MSLFLELIPMTHAPETDAINRLPFPGVCFRRRFFVQYASGVKISGGKNERIKVIIYSVHCSVLCFALDMTIKISIYQLGLCLLYTFGWCFSFFVTCTPVSVLKLNSVLIGAGIWYQTNPVQIYMTHVPETGAGKWSRFIARRFLERVSWVLFWANPTRDNCVFSTGLHSGCFNVAVKCPEHEVTLFQMTSELRSAAVSVQPGRHIITACV